MAKITTTKGSTKHTHKTKVQAIRTPLVPWVNSDVPDELAVHAPSEM